MSRFGKLAKHRSTPTASISFRSSKVDDDENQLQFSYSKAREEGEEETSAVAPGQESGQLLEKCDNKQFPETKESEMRDGASKSEKDFQNDLLSVKDSPATDSIRDYLSKLPRRPCSLDSESSQSSKSDEGWPLLREIKGKIAKTLEDHIAKESRSKSGERVKSLPKQEAVPYMDEWPDDDVVIVDTPNDDDSDKTSNLSPAIEASEMMTEDGLVDSFKSLESKCEIVASKSYSPLNTALSRKSVRSKSEVSMSLSSLMTNRCPSYESETDKKTFEEEEPLKARTIENEPHSSCESNLDKNAEVLYNVIFKIGKFCRLLIPSRSSVIYYALVLVLASVVHLFSSWLSGFLLGTALSCAVTWWLLKPREPKQVFTLPNYEQMPPLTIPVSDTEEKSIIHKGWMNELTSEYDPETYHVNTTHSVYIRLDGSYLRLSYPRSNIPRRAMFNEPSHQLHFLFQRHHDLTGATVHLLPDGLARTRLWSKKYPICLVIPDSKRAISPDETPRGRESPVKRYVPLRNEGGDVVLYLFSRTNRDKDIWLQRFEAASCIKMLNSPSSSLSIPTMESPLESKRAVSVDLAALQLSSHPVFEGNLSRAAANNGELEDDELDSFVEVKLTKQLLFEKYMSQLLSPLLLEHAFLGNIPKRLRKEKRGMLLRGKEGGGVGGLVWLNVLIGRIFFDLLTEEVWARLISERIQRKLNKIKLPNFLEGLMLRDLQLGAAFPKIQRASDPVLDQRGLWVDLDLSYSGSFQMTLETKLNLLRLSGKAPMEQPLVDLAAALPTPRSHIYNSEEEDSAESSSDDEMTLPEVSVGPPAPDDSSAAGGSGGAGKRIIRLVDRLAHSSYFQNATRYKYVQRAMKEVSNTPIVLTVEVPWLAGTLALNVPPLPTDRLWYGFRENPELSLVARPKLGQHAVTITHVTEWIERKLVSEFQKILVMPNMDDLIIPIMLPADNLLKT